MVKEYLLVDGYNIIFAWQELDELARENLESARMKLADILCNYQGYEKNEVILVFDGHKTKGNPGSVIHYHNIDIVYTKEAQSADQYIERVAQQMGRECRIRVATSDATEQIVILGKGAVRMSARELKLAVKAAELNIRQITDNNRQSGRNRLMDNLPAKMAMMLEEMRLREDGK